MKRLLKRILQSIRILAWRFVLCPEAVQTIQSKGGNLIRMKNTIFYKAGWILAPELVEGDYLEFGVYKGASLISAYHILKNVYTEAQVVSDHRTATDIAKIGQVWEKMRFFAFDSFEGLPEIEGLDAQGNDFAIGKYTYAEARFRDNLAKEGVPLAKVVTVPGWFERTCSAETIGRFGIKSAAIIHVDCDLYSSAKTVLEFVKPLLVDGTIIIFDDWFCFRGNPDLGEQRAFAEWKATMLGWRFTEFQREGPWRVSFIASKSETGSIG
jgi:hypothetical protein